MYNVHMTSKSGFTIVELLIVIVVIGILAAITTVAFNGVSARAKEASVQSDVKNNIKNILLYRAEKTAEMNCSDFITTDSSVNPYPFKISNASDVIQSNYVYATKPDASGGWPGFAPPYEVAYIVVMKSGKVFAALSNSQTPRDVTSFYTAAGNSTSGAIQGAYSVVVGAGCFLGP